VPGPAQEEIVQQALLFEGRCSEVIRPIIERLIQWGCAALEGVWDDEECHYSSS
jgi:hypothetical protein